MSWLCNGFSYLAGMYMLYVNTTWAYCKHSPCDQMYANYCNKWNGSVYSALHFDEFTKYYS